VIWKWRPAAERIDRCRARSILGFAAGTGCPETSQSSVVPRLPPMLPGAISSVQCADSRRYGALGVAAFQSGLPEWLRREPRRIESAETHAWKMHRDCRRHRRARRFPRVTRRRSATVVRRARAYSPARFPCARRHRFREPIDPDSGAEIEVRGGARAKGVQNSGAGPFADSRRAQPVLRAPRG